MTQAQSDRRDPLEAWALKVNVAAPAPKVIPGQPALKASQAPLAPKAKQAPKVTQVQPDQAAPWGAWVLKANVAVQVPKVIPGQLEFKASLAPLAPLAQRAHPASPVFRAYKAQRVRLALLGLWAPRGSA